MDGKNRSTFTEFSSSVVALCIVFLLSSSITFSIVSDKLITTPMTSNSRYAVTFPALEYITHHDEDAVVAIGSSIIQASVDGVCITDAMNTPDITVFNLGISGANPYTEILQIPALVKAKPELVLLDLGPNSLWNYNSDESLDEYIQFRFTINSIMMSQGDIGDWTRLIRDEDRQWLAYTFEERMKLTQSYSQKSADYILQNMASTFNEDFGVEARAPLPGDEDWHQYLMQPYMDSFARPPFFELKSDAEIQEYLGEKMPKKAKQGVYNPRANGTLNHAAYEYIIGELRDAEIPILMVATPHHPKVNSYLSPGQLDGFNQTFNQYANLSGVYGVNMYWEEWHTAMFRDRNHLGDAGREYFCERISPYIDKMLADGGLENDVVQIEGINLSNYLENTCSGSDVTTLIEKQIHFIQAETYSDCAYGEGVGYSDTWEFQNKGQHRGSGYLHALPEDVSQYKGSILGSRLDYNITFEEPGEYFVWLRMRGNSYGNDTVGLVWDFNNHTTNQFETYSSYGWTSEGQWEWEPEFNRAPFSINITEEQTHKLSVFMMEDGVEFDEIMITTIADIKPKSLDVHAIEQQSLACKGTDDVFTIPSTGEWLIEAEDYSSCVFGTGESVQHQWSKLDGANASGQSYVQALPDLRVHMRDEQHGPSLIYDLNFESNGTYYAWLLMRGNSYGNDTVSLIFHEGSTSQELKISSYGWDSYGQWEWEPKVSRVPLAMNITDSTATQIVVAMREDGVEVDAIIITDNPLFDPIKEW